MNREITGGGGASAYPLVGDVLSTPGQGPVTVVGLQNIPVVVSFPTGGEVLTYDGTSNQLILGPPVTTVELKTNGVDNSVQNLLNLSAGTNITLTESGGTVLIDAASLGTQRSATITNANGSYWTWTDGIIEQWGSATMVSTGTNNTGGIITFPTVFPTVVQSLIVTLVTLPNTGSTDLATIQVSNFTGSGAVVNAMCPVPTGGGGTTFNQTQTFHWRAIGN